MSAAPATEPDLAGHRALLTDGTVVCVRRLGTSDRAAVDVLHRDLPFEDSYLRFFTGARASAEAIADVIVADDAVAVGVFRGDRLLGVAHYRPEPGGADPELAVAVAHPEQHHGWLRCYWSTSCPWREPAASSADRRGARRQPRHAPCHP